MSSIKINRNELLLQAKKLSQLKEEIDNIQRSTLNAYSLVNSIWEVSTWSEKRSIERVRSASNNASIDLQNLIGNLYNSIKEFDIKEAEINKKVEINKKSITSENRRIIRDEIKGAILAYNPRDYLRAKYFSDFGFKFIKKDGKIFLKSTSRGAINSNRDFQLLRDKFTDNLGGTSKWNKPDLEKLVNEEGLALFDIDTGKGYKSNINKFKNSKFETLVDSIDDVGDSLDMTVRGKMLSGSKKAFVEGIDVLDDFKPSSWKGAATSTKVVKGIGAVGTVITVVDNLENFKDENGNVQINVDNTVDFAVDFSVDIGAGAVASGVGGAIGSLILPPLGTVVGMAVGTAVGIGLNIKWIGDPPESIVDSTKNAIDKVADVVVGGIGNLCSNIGQSLSLVFW